MAQRAAMLDLRRAWPDRKIVLIGASALACWLEMKWRRTNDLDLTVVADQAELAAELGDLAWKRDTRFEQRWTSPQDVIVDILPASAADIAKGRLIFAVSGHVMNLTAFDLAFARSATLNLDERAAIEIATDPRRCPSQDVSLVGPSLRARSGRQRIQTTSKAWLTGAPIHVLGQSPNLSGQPATRLGT